MKKFNLLSIVVFFSLVALLPSCKNDDDGGPSQNEFVLNDETYSLAKGFIEDYGANGNGSFDFDVTLTSSEISYSAGTATYSGTGNLIYLDLNTGLETGLEEGTYTFSTTREAFSFVDSQVAVNFDADALTGDVFEVTGGTVEVELDGTEVTITFNLEISNGTTVMGSYKGTLQTI